MGLSRSEPGIIISGTLHALMLVGILVAFSTTPQFKDAQESVPVEVLTEEQFNQIAKGEREAPVKEPAPRVDKQADTPSEAPKPPVQEAVRETPTPPPDLRRLPDPGEANEPVPEPPQRAEAPPPELAPPELAPPEPTPAPPVPLPPVRPPDPVKVAVAKPEPVPAPKPVPKPEPKPEQKPEPQAAQSKPVPVPPRRPNIPNPPKEKPPEKPKPDQLAKLLEKTRDVKPAPRPRSGEPSNEPRTKYDPGAINKLLSKEKPSQRAATGSTVNPQASRGSPTANAPKMSPSMWGQLDGLLQDQYKRCWNYAGLANGQRYIPQISVNYAASGNLVGQPRLLNPPSDPALRSLADSALRAVQRCNPLRIPAQFAPFYEQWKSRVLRFDPEEMMG